MDFNLRPRSGDSRRSPISYLGIPVAALAVFGLAACGTTSEPASGSGHTDRQAAAGAAPAAAAQSHAAGFCQSRDLSVRVAPLPSEAGHPSSRLVFHNVSGHSCVLRGYPGVSTVAGDDGHQVGHAAVRKAAFAPVSTVRLAPDGRAYAFLRQVSIENYSNARCAPRHVRGLRVYPPEETAAKYVPFRTSACADRSVGRPQIGAITARPI